MITKRFWIALVVLAFILAICTVSTWDMRRSLDELESEVGRMIATSPESPTLEEQAKSLVNLWEQKENHFVLYVNHNTLDHITQMISELPSLARFSENSHLYSHLDSIMAALDDLWKSSIPSYKTLL